jgi:hypothetical protein
MSARRMKSFACLLVASCVAHGGAAHAAESFGPTVTLVDFERDLPNGKARGLSNMLFEPVQRMIEACGGRQRDWSRRADIQKEIAFQQTKYVDPTTAAKPGQLLQPDVFITGTVSGDANNFTWKIEAVAAVGGEVIAADSGSAPNAKLSDFALHDQITKRLIDKVCKLRAGYRIDGKMDDASIRGTICGNLDKPFTAVSPEVAGTWDFTPTTESGGTFSYQAKNIGGATGSGAGTYVLTPAPQGGGKIRLAGKGTVHSPVGDFSAAITESISLTPLRSCGRVGTE